MKWLFTSFVMGLSLASHAQTQQWGQVYFANHVFWPPRLVSSLSGIPLVGTNFIAELYYGTSASSMVLLTNGSARFRPQGTIYPGTWFGGMRTLVGIPPGTPTFMQVALWNNDDAGSLQEAFQNRSPHILVSSVFTYTPPPPGSSIDAHYMSNFVAFWGSCGSPLPRQPSILVQPTNQTVRAGDTVVISVVSTNACAHQWQFNGTNINVLPGSRFLVLTNVQPSQAGDYRVIIDPSPSPHWFQGLTSQVARLTVEPPPQWGEVNFANDMFTPPRLPFFPDTSSVVGTNFVAQLFYGTNQNNLIAVTNPPAPFTSSLPGYWRGGMRTLVGIAPGTRVHLQVKVWDSAWGASLEEALASGGWGIGGVLFTYTPPPHGSPPEAYHMHNFTSFGYLCAELRPPAIMQQPTNQVASVGQTVTLWFDGTGCMVQWQFNGTNLLRTVRSRGLRIDNVQLHHQGDYQVIIAPGNPAYAITSQVARLTVRPPPQFTSARYDDGAFAFHVSEETGRAVVIETAPDLNPGTTWTPVFTNTAPFSFTNSTPADRQRFYRTVIR